MSRVVDTALALATILGMSYGGGAIAAEDPPIATAASTQPPLTSLPGVALPDPTADQIDAWLKADGSSVRRPAPDEPESLTPAPRAIHGEVGASVSNRGYSAYGAASVPIGRASELDVAVADGRVNYPHGGSANPKSLSLGLRLDGRDINSWLSHNNCGVPRWGVALKGDPQVRADGTCEKGTDQASSSPTGTHPHNKRGGQNYGTTTSAAPVGDVGPVPAQTGASPTP